MKGSSIICIMVLTSKSLGRPMTKPKEGVDSPLMPLDGGSTLMPLVHFMQNFKNAMNTISHSREGNIKKFHRKRRHKHQIKRSWSEEIVYEMTEEEQILQLLSQSNFPIRIYAPNNNDRFDEWGGYHVS